MLNLDTLETIRKYLIETDNKQALEEFAYFTEHANANAGIQDCEDMLTWMQIAFNAAVWKIERAEQDRLNHKPAEQ